MVKKLSLFLIAAILTYGCIDPLDIEVEDESAKLVVFAEITDQQEKYTVELSRTSNYESVNPTKVVGATVSVFDSRGSEYVFTEEKEGVYRSCPSEFIGKIGESYKLRINTADEKIYESSLEEILPTGEIDSVYFKRSEKYVLIDGRTRPLKGLRLFCSFKDSPAKDYYKVDWSGTFKFKSSVLDSLYDYCWLTESNDFDINLYEDSYTNNSLKEDYEITFLEKGFRFVIDYSFQVQLKSLNRGAFTFWRLVKQQYENDGSIFSALPSLIDSNVKCVTDEEEKVLGYFVTSAQSSKRVRISPYDPPGRASTAILPGCSVANPKYAYPYCHDCSKYFDSTGEEPTFW